MTPYLLNGDKKDCCCCGMCAKSCPVNAITLQEDEDGFLYPELDKNKCISCNKCARVCQYTNETPKLKYLEAVQCFACKNADVGVLEQSASGGLFHSLAISILKKKGAIFGAAWQEGYKVSQECVLEESALGKLQGSKYVFCDIGNSFFDVQNILSSGKDVLFTGTPCQVAGLYSYLGCDYKNLYTCDLICHGMPSHQYLKMFMDELSDTYKSQITSIDFKNKEHGWRKPQLYIRFANGKVYKQHIWNSSYGKLYHQRLTTMASCNACVYATMPRKSDITMGDFWGYSEEKHHLGEEQPGVSLAMVNTEKGQHLFDMAKEYLLFNKISLDEAMQLHLRESAKPPCKERKNKFLRMIERYPLSIVLDKVNYRTIREQIVDVGVNLKRILIHDCILVRERHNQNKHKRI